MMVRLFAPLLLLLATAVSGIIATPILPHAELAKRDVTTDLEAELVQLHAVVVTLQTGVSAITSTSSPNQIATFNINVQAVLKVVGDIKDTLVTVGTISGSDATSIVGQLEAIFGIVVSTLNALVGDAKVVANTVAGPELNDIEKSTVALGNSLDELVDAVVGDLDPYLIVLIKGLVQAKADCQSAVTLAENAYLQA